MLVTFLDRAYGSKTGPLYMIGEQAEFSEAIAQEFIDKGVAEATAPPPAKAEPEPVAPTVDRPEKDRMVRKGEVVRK